MLNTAFRAINEQLFGTDDPEPTQIDWIAKQSRHQIYLLDGLQAVRPADLAVETTRSLVEVVRHEGRHHRLVSQMRVRADSDYVGYIRDLLDARDPAPRDFGDYDLKLFDDLGTYVYVCDAELRAFLRRCSE